jgi:hypothetical protein
MDSPENCRRRLRTANCCSIGLKSGEYLGSGNSVCPWLARISLILGLLWKGALSMITKLLPPTKGQILARICFNWNHSTYGTLIGLQSTRHRNVNPPCKVETSLSVVCPCNLLRAFGRALPSSSLHANRTNSAIIRHAAQGLSNISTRPTARHI